MHKRVLAVLTAACMFAGLPLAAQAAGGDFHAPSSDAEQALDGLLGWQAILDGDLATNDFDYLTGHPDRSTKDDAEFKARYTDALVAAIRATEKQLVQENCNGTYSQDDICGIDFDPIQCAQDLPDNGWEYQTADAGPTAARIETRWKGGQQLAGTYRMVKVAGTWKLDGVVCGDGSDPNSNFNLKP